MVDNQSNHSRSKTRKLTKSMASLGAVAFVGVCLWLLVADNSPSTIKTATPSAATPRPSISSADAPLDSSKPMATIASRKADKAVYGARNDLSTRISINQRQFDTSVEPSKPKVFKSPAEELEYLESRLEGEKQLLAFRKRATEYIGRKIQKNRDFDERVNLLEEQTIVEARFEEQKEAVANLEKRIADLRDRVR